MTSLRARAPRPHRTPYGLLPRALLGGIIILWVSTALFLTLPLLAPLSAASFIFLTLTTFSSTLIPAAVVLFGRARLRTQTLSERHALDVAFSHPASEVGECVGWKVARLAAHGDHVWLTGAFQGMYQAQATALCARGESHRVPDVYCTCGFHAWTDRERALAYLREQAHADLEVDPRLPRSYVVLRVELSGDILEFEHGFRAESQDVLGVELAAACARCGAPASCLDWLPGHLADLGLPSCASCASERACTLAELASRLGAECSFRACSQAS